jgi:hypothetical protein
MPTTKQQLLNATAALVLLALSTAAPAAAQTGAKSGAAAAEPVAPYLGRNGST